MKTLDDKGKSPVRPVFSDLVHARPVPGRGEGCGIPAGVACGEKAPEPSGIVAHGRREGGGHFLALDVASTSRGAFAVEILEKQGRVHVRIIAPDEEGLAWLKGRAAELARLFERSGLHVLGLTLESRGGREARSGDTPGKGATSSKDGGIASLRPVRVEPSPDDTELIG